MESTLTSAIFLKKDCVPFGSNLFLLQKIICNMLAHQRGTVQSLSKMNSFSDTITYSFSHDMVTDVGICSKSVGGCSQPIFCKTTKAATKGQMPLPSLLTLKVLPGLSLALPPRVPEPLCRHSAPRLEHSLGNVLRNASFVSNLIGCLITKDISWVSSPGRSTYFFSVLTWYLSSHPSFPTHQASSPLLFCMRVVTNVTSDVSALDICACRHQRFAAVSHRLTVGQCACFLPSAHRDNWVGKPRVPSKQVVTLLDPLGSPP